MGSCTEELWPSFNTSESEGVRKREATQEELQGGERAEGLVAESSSSCDWPAGGGEPASTCRVQTVHGRRCSGPWAGQTP